MTHYKHRIRFYQDGWESLDAATTHAEQCHEVEQFILDPNLGMHRKRVKVTKVTKLGSAVYRIHARASRSAVNRMTSGWSDGQLFMLDGKWKRVRAEIS